MKPSNSPMKQSKAGRQAADIPFQAASSLEEERAPLKKKLRGADYSSADLRKILQKDAAFAQIAEREKLQLADFVDFLMEYNQKINLTALSKAEDIAYLHLLDSLTLLPLIESLGFATEEAWCLLDVGSGAGLPGIPLKIMRPSWKITLLDSLAKRTRFQEAVKKHMLLPELYICWGRAEQMAHGEMREKFDLVTARALARLPLLLEYCLPYVKLGGYFIAMKGDPAQELDGTRQTLRILGGEIVEIKCFELEGSGQKRSLIAVKKIKASPRPYPRTQAQMDSQALL